MTDGLRAELLAEATRLRDEHAVALQADRPRTGPRGEEVERTASRMPLSLGPRAIADRLTRPPPTSACMQGRGLKGAGSNTQRSEVDRDSTTEGEVDHQHHGERH